MSGPATKFFFSLLSISLLVVLCSGEENLYGVLSVPRTATATQIKAAFRKMAKKWHPDKNKAPAAKEKFISINKAYEVLSDSKKRRRYDMTGETGDPKPHSFHRHPDDIFTFFRSGPMMREDGIMAEDFFDRVLPGSHKKLYLLYFFNEFCIQCMGVDQIWAELSNELGPLEVGMGTVSTSFEPKITRYCGVSDVPAIVGVVLGRVVHYRQHIGSSRDIKSFLVRIFPSRLVTEITDDKSAGDFLAAVFTRNRPRVVLTFRLPSPPLSYLLAAFYMRESLDFAYISTGAREGAMNAGVNLGKVKVGYGKKQLFVFKEDPLPYLVNNVTSSQVDFHKLRDNVEDVTLYLPRLSSPSQFDTFCSVDKTRLCLILVVDSEDQYNDSLTAAFRTLSMTGSHPSHAILLYMYAPSQSAFLKTFGWSSRTTEKCGIELPARKILILRWKTSKTVQYSWLDQYCGGPLPDMPSTFDLKSLKSGALTSMIVDEEGPGFLARIWATVEDYCYTALRMIDTQGLYFLFSLLVTGIMVCLVVTATGTQEESTSRQEQKHKTHSSNTGLPQFNKKIYEDMKQSQKRVMTLIVFAEDTSEAKSVFENVFGQHHFNKVKISAFYDSCNNGVNFLEMLLTHCSEVNEEELKSRVRGCKSRGVATAVCLIGSKQQLMMYPQECDLVDAFLQAGRKNGGKPKKKESGTKRTTGEVLGATLGYDSSSDEEDDDDMTGKDHSCATEEGGGVVECSESSLVDQVTHSFGNWLDRLADGSLRRHAISKWPEWT